MEEIKKEESKDKARKNRAGSLTVFAVIMCLVVVGGLGIYYQILKKQHMRTQTHTPTTETEKLIAKDLDVGYPETPMEVMKLWGRINQCMYNSALTDEQYSQLLGQLRCLYSSELLEENKEEDHSVKLKNEIAEFQEKKSKIINYSAETGQKIQYKTIRDRDCAYIKISYFIGRKTGHTKLYQNFVLIQEEGKWKILGFKDKKEEPVSEEEAVSGKGK